MTAMADKGRGRPWTSSSALVWSMLGLLLLLGVGLVDWRPVQAKPNLPVRTGPGLSVLVFGGNGLLGAPTVLRLLEAGHNVTLVNRGNWYWDTATTIAPRVTHFRCDRMQTLRACKGLVEWLEEEGSVDVIIDFSAYHVFSLKEALTLFEGRADLYVFISTDSVYEVCQQTQHEGFSREEDALRPSSREQRRLLEEKESYGHRKLECEEELRARRMLPLGMPYLVLRLPDVIGPRDNTYRWWIYQLWMRLERYLDKPVSVPETYARRQMSLVYAPDVADLILSQLRPSPAVLDRAFNLAFNQTPTLLDMLTDIKTALNLSNLVTRTDPGPDAIHLFPSVQRGPVNTSRALHELAWRPSSWQQAMQETVDFYEDATRNPDFEVPRRDIIRTMQMYFTSRPFKILGGLKHEYGVHYPEERDEL